MMARGGSMPGEIALKARARSPTASAVISRVEGRSEEVDGPQNHDSHPQDGKAEQPVAHVSFPRFHHLRTLSAHSVFQRLGAPRRKRHGPP
jgi:hypothetical protein